MPAGSSHKSTEEKLLNQAAADGCPEGEAATAHRGEAAADIPGVRGLFDQIVAPFGGLRLLLE